MYPLLTYTIKTLSFIIVIGNLSFFSHLAPLFRVKTGGWAKPPLTIVKYSYVFGHLKDKKSDKTCETYYYKLFQNSQKKYK